jgi:hypothetical protein
MKLVCKMLFICTPMAAMRAPAGMLSDHGTDFGNGGGGGSGSVQISMPMQSPVPDGFMDAFHEYATQLSRFVTDDESARKLLCPVPAAVDALVTNRSDSNWNAFQAELGSRLQAAYGLPVAPAKLSFGSWFPGPRYLAFHIGNTDPFTWGVTLNVGEYFSPYFAQTRQAGGLSFHFEYGSWQGTTAMTLCHPYGNLAQGEHDARVRYLDGYIGSIEVKDASGRLIDAGYFQRDITFLHAGKHGKALTSVPGDFTLVVYGVNPEPLSPEELCRRYPLRAGACDAVTTLAHPSIIAVWDSGIDYNHPTLSSRILRDAAGKMIGQDLIDGDDRPFDVSPKLFGHGTHVSGILTEGARDILILPQRVTDGSRADPSTTPRWVDLFPVLFPEEVDFLQAMDFAYRHGARIVNISFGAYGSHTPAIRTLTEVIRKYPDVLFVTAAGNDHVDSDDYTMLPANLDLPNVVAVAATDAEGHLAAFSNYGRAVALAAPGVNVESTNVGGDRVKGSGTSVSAPVVSRIAARAWRLWPAARPADLIQLMMDSSDRRPELAGRVRAGGTVNEAAALRLAAAHGKAP